MSSHSRLKIAFCAAVLALAGCAQNRDDDENANAQPIANPQTLFIGLPNGATISVEPGSIGQQLATYFASNDPAPRSFEIGGDQFEDWSATAKPEIQALVPGMVALLKSYPDVRIRLIGHTDNEGDPAANLKLSSARAETAKQHLVEAGISDVRIEAVGMGMTRPIASNDTAEGRAKNRRIEIEVVAK